MDPKKIKNEPAVSSSPGYGLFIGGTVLAAIITIIVIILSRAGAGNEFILPPTTSTTAATTPNNSVVAYGTSYGAPNAPVTLVVYSDFQCYYCQQFTLGISKQLDDSYIKDGKVRMVYRHFIAYGDESQLAAEAAECAAEQNQFWPYHDLLMQLRLSPTKADLTQEQLIELAQQVGLDVDKFRNSLTSGKFKAKVIQESNEGKALGIANLPKFYFNGVVADDSIGKSFENFQAVIDNILAAGSK